LGATLSTDKILSTDYTDYHGFTFGELRFASARVSPHPPFGHLLLKEKDLLTGVLNAEQISRSMSPCGYKFS